jgi:VanZ family protein
MQKRWIWWVVIIIFGVAFYRFTASPLSNDAHTLMLLKRLKFLSGPELILLTKIVRKAAHLCTFAVLAMCLRNAMYPHPMTYPSAWVLSTLYGAGDEFHQLFVPGRTPLFSDVMIDSLGAALGLLIIYWSHRKRWR